MKLLLDTHTLLWLMNSHPNLSRTAQSILQDPLHELYLSMASIWEIGIKSGMGKLVLSVPFSTFLETAIAGYGLNLLPITTHNCIRYQAMLFPDPQHRDPFDRMIITQALQENMAIIGSDSSFDLYGVTRIW